MPQRVEPSLLNIFRLFVGLRIGVSLLSGVRPGHGFVLDNLWLIGVSATISVLLLAYLSSRWLEQHLRQFYLPLALITLSVMLLAESRTFQWILVTGDIRATDLPDFVQSYLLPVVNRNSLTLLITLGGTTSLLVPVVLTSWQYNFRALIVSVIVMTSLDLALYVYLLQPADLTLELFAVLSRNMTFFIVGYIVSQLAATQRNQQTALQASNRKLTLYAATSEKLAVSQERNRLARELHDTIAHTMSGVTVKLNAVHLIMDRDPARAKTMLAEVIHSMNDGMSETRRALRDLRATPLDDLGLVLAVRHLAESAAQRGGFTLDLQTSSNALRFDADIELVAYRITQEALTNIVEHANASLVSLTLNVTPHTIALCIEDNGSGFDVEQARLQGRFGLQGMYERAAMLAAELTIQSVAGQGTKIQLLVEVKP